MTCFLRNIEAAGLYLKEYEEFTLLFNLHFNVLPKVEFGFYMWLEEKRQWPDSWGSESKKKKKMKESH